jgi:hypothetical protein
MTRDGRVKRKLLACLLSQLVNVSSTLRENITCSDKEEMRSTRALIVAWSGGMLWLVFISVRMELMSSRVAREREMRMAAVLTREKKKGRRSRA